MVQIESLVLEEPEVLRRWAFDVPEVGPEDALLEVGVAGICGTDWKTFHGSTPYQLPLIMGHEIVGRLAVVGEAFVERTGRSVGERVTVGGSVPCWSCDQCYMGLFRFCARKRGYGTSTPCTVPPGLWGAFGEFMYLTGGSIVFPVAEGIPAEAAVLTQGAIANGYEWVGEHGGVRPGDSVLILGCGPQGIACALVAKERGAGLVVMTGLSRDEQRLELAEEFGVDVVVNVEEDDLQARVRGATGGEMIDVAVDVSGSPRAGAAAIGVLRRKSTLVVAGLSGKGARAEFELDDLVWKEIALKGAYTRGGAALRSAVKTVNSGRYPLERIVSHSFPLDAADEAIRSIGGEVDGCYPTKAVIRPHAA